jgi:adenylylsulfate kinase
MGIPISLSVHEKTMVWELPNSPLAFEWPEQRKAKEAMLHQHGCVLWMCGLSGAGKSTLAMKLDRMLTARGFLSQVIDGDVVRGGLNKGLGFSVEDRAENLRRVAELSRLFVQCGVITVVSFISPTCESRLRAASIIGETDFWEVYINAPLEVCEARDTKGLYRQAREGLLHDFTGIDSPFEVPEKPAIEIRTDLQDADFCAGQLLDFLLPMIAYKD